jgi:assimilatory nitrate reductase catalytic subunit
MGDYAAIARTPSGWQGEFAGQMVPSDWAALAAQCLGCNGADLVSTYDRGSHTYRFAQYNGAQLAGLFFASSQPVRLARHNAISLIGTDVPALAAMAGRIGAGQPDPGRTLCACMNVGVNTVQRAIDTGATTTDAVGIATRAGTNCGSCKPEIQALLAAATLLMAAQ